MDSTNCQLLKEEEEVAKDWPTATWPSWCTLHNSNSNAKQNWTTFRPACSRNTHGQHICSASTQCESSCALLRFQQPKSDTCPDRSSVRRGKWGTRCISLVGIGTCEEQSGPTVLCAAFPGTTPDAFSQQPKSPRPSTATKVQLSLERLLQFSTQDDALHQAALLYEQLRQPWPDTCFLRDTSFVMMLPDLAPEVQWIFKHFPVWHQDPVEMVHVYVDGSSFENRHMLTYDQAAWAFIVILQCNADGNVSYQYYAAVSNPLSKAATPSNEYHGVGELSYDPLSSEATGMILTMCWLAQSPFQCQHVVHYDNCTIGNCAAGTARWNAKWEHSQLHTNLCAMRHCLEAAKRQAVYAHVKAHEGHPHNELADALAKATAKGIIAALPLPAVLSRVMLNRQFKYAWMNIADSRSHPKPAALSGLFKAEGPFAPREVDVTWWHPVPEDRVEGVDIAITVASANVLTLAPGPKHQQLQGLFQKGRISTIQQQCHEANVHVIGLQECRTQGAVVRHSTTHWVFQSGASQEGARGCELWLSRQLPYAVSDGKPHHFDASHVHIAAFSDRFLLAIVRAPHLHVRFLIAHAPHAAASDVDCEQWWNDLQDIVYRIGNQLPLILLGDMNAQLGSAQSDAVGPIGQELENSNGHLFHAFLMENDLWLPATFSTSHSGTHTTWRSSEGHPHRLDFVVLPLSWKTFEVKSFVNQDIDLCTTRDDHEVVCATIHMRRRQSSSHRARPIRIDIRKCQDPQAKAQFTDYLQHPPQIPWECGTGLHAELLTEWLQKGARQCFPKSVSLPKQRYMSEFTWQLVLLRKQLKKTMMQSEKHAALISLRISFDAWSHCCNPRSQFLDMPNDFLTQSQPELTILYPLRQQMHRSFAWALFQRNKLQSAARQSSRADRIKTAQDLVDQFYQVAHQNDSKALYRHLKPLLGQQFRKSINQFRPIPAIRLADDTLARDHDEASKRWQTHFATAEQGIPVTVTQMQELAQLQSSCYPHAELSFDLASLPTLTEIEAYIHKAKTGKSPGIDGLPSEIYRLAPSTIAQLLWPLLAKCAVRCVEPLRWQGGEVCAIPKIAQVSSRVEHFRSILLADFSSKVCHGLVRSKLLPSLEQYRLTMQAGGIPGLGTDMLHLFVQSFAQHTKHLGMSSAAVFVDIKQAFYRACRPLLVRKTVTLDHVAQLFSQNGWSLDLFHSFQQRLAEAPALEQAHVSSHQIAQVQAMLSTTWFQLRSCPETLTSTACGTRPGDSIADLLYTFLMTRYMKALRERFIAADLHTSFELKWIPPASLQPGDMDPQHIVQACWVDDLVLLLQDSQADQLVRKIRTAIGLTQDLAVEFGLTLNYGPDKTAVLPVFRGPQAEHIRRAMLSHNPDKPSISFTCASMPTEGCIDVVPTYIYLGQAQDHKGHPAAEIHRRFTVIKASSRLLNRNIFRSPRMPYKTKAMLHKTLVMSKLLYGSGAWQHMHIQTARSWNNQIMQMYSRLAPTLQRGPGTYTTWTSLQIAVCRTRNSH